MRQKVCRFVAPSTCASSTSDRGGEKDRDDAAQRRICATQPVHVSADEAERHEHIVEQSVVGVEHPFPHHRHRHRSRDHRQIKHAAKKGCMKLPHLINRRSDPQRKQACEGHADQYDDQRVNKRLAEFHILEHTNVVAKTDKGELGERIMKRAVEQAHEHGKDDEPKEKNKRRRHKQISGNILMPACGTQTAVDAGGILHAVFLPFFEKGALYPQEKRPFQPDGWTY